MDIELVGAFYVVTGLAVTVGFHRHFTHGAFKASPALRMTLAALGIMAVQGPVTEWVADHRRHHAFSDRQGDPHSPWLYGTGPRALARGFWHAHLGWIFDRGKTNLDRFAPDLLADQQIQAVDRLFVLWTVLTFGLPALLGGLLAGSWWGAITALFWAGLVRVSLLHHVAWSVNSVCHLVGAPVCLTGQGRELLAAGHRVLRRVVAQLPPRRPDLRPSRRAARPARHLRPTDLVVRETRLGLECALAGAKSPRPAQRAPLTADSTPLGGIVPKIQKQHRS